MHGFLNAFARAVAALPLGLAQALGRALGSIGYVLIRRHRRAQVRELERCFPGLARSDLKRRLRRVYQGMALNYIEVFRWLGGRAEELEARIAVSGFEHYERAAAAGRGVLVLTAHTGNWDLLGLWAARRMPLTIISKELRSRGANRFWMEARARCGIAIVPAHNSYRACLAALRRGGTLGFILDQNMTRMEGIFVEFFGKPACTTPGLAFMAAHTRAPVLPVFILRAPDGTHRVEFHPALDPPPDREPDTLRRATQDYTRRIEDVIRRHPDQWIWMHRRWRTQPPADERGPARAVEPAG